jgi:hypothetical protein
MAMKRKAGKKKAAKKGGKKKAAKRRRGPVGASVIRTPQKSQSN